MSSRMDANIQRKAIIVARSPRLLLTCFGGIFGEDRPWNKAKSGPCRLSISAALTGRQTGPDALWRGAFSAAPDPATPGTTAGTRAAAAAILFPGKWYNRDEPEDMM